MKVPGVLSSWLSFRAIYCCARVTQTDTYHSIINTHTLFRTSSFIRLSSLQCQLLLSSSLDLVLGQQL